MKKIVYCCSLIAGLMLSMASTAGAVWCNGKNVGCSAPYSCVKYTSCLGTCCGADNSDGYPTCVVSPQVCPMAKAAPKKAEALVASAAAKTNWMAKVLDLIATPASATNCWSGNSYAGYRNGSNQTGGTGTSKNCEAKLHVCYTNGASDGGIPCTINSTTACDNACNNTTTASQVACAYSDCTSRCYAARVSGYSDTCN